jgi:hypothetical protein
VRRHLHYVGRRTWVPLTIVAVLATGLFVGVPAYYTHTGELPVRGLTAPELSWARAYAPWRAELAAALDEAYENRTSVDGTLGRLLARLENCDAALAERVPPPPTERLAPVAQALAGSCRAAQAALAEYRANADTPTWLSTRALAAAAGTLQEGEVEFRRLMQANRLLEETSDRSVGSRIEPLLAPVVSGVFATSVKCWSAREWPQVRAELAAVGDERDARTGELANAYRRGVHASPEVCDAALGLVAAGSDPPATSEQAVSASLLALLHAAAHAVGIEDEREAVCDAVANVRGAALRLGASRATAAALGRAAATRSRCP